MVIIMWHEKWTVDGVSCGNYDELREGVCESGQEGQRQDSRRGGRGDGVVAVTGWSRDNARRRLTAVVQHLLKLAKDKTEQIYLASFSTALPDIRKGIRVKAS